MTLFRCTKRVLLAAAISVLFVPASALAITWAPAQALTDATDANAWPNSIAAVGSRIHVIYRQLDDKDRRVLYRRSVDGGATWKDAVELSRPSAISSARTALSATSAGVDAVWVDGNLIDGPSALWYRTSPGGATWSDARRLSPVTTSNVGIPVVARSGTLVIVAYTDWDTGAVYIRRSADGGQTWQGRVRVGSTTWASISGSSAFDGVPSVAIGNGVAYLVWGSTANNVRVSRSLNAGATWQPYVTLETRNDESAPRIAAAGSSAIVTFGYFDGTTNGYARIRQTGDRGAHWSAARRISGGSLPASSQDIEWAGGKWRTSYAQCLRQDCTTGWSLWYRQSLTGATWSAPSRYSTLARPYPVSIGLAYTSSNHRVWGAWTGFDYDASDGDIYVRGSTSGAETFDDIESSLAPHPPVARVRAGPAALMLR
jgi:hypothetical protein